MSIIALIKQQLASDFKCASAIKGRAGKLAGVG